MCVLLRLVPEYAEKNSVPRLRKILVTRLGGVRLRVGVALQTGTAHETLQGEGRRVREVACGALGSRESLDGI